MPGREWNNDVIHHDENDHAVRESEDNPAPPQIWKPVRGVDIDRGDEDPHEFLQYQAECGGRGAARERALRQQAPCDGMQDEWNATLIDEASCPDVNRPSDQTSRQDSTER